MVKAGSSSHFFMLMKSRQFHFELVELSSCTLFITPYAQRLVIGQRGRCDITSDALRNTADKPLVDYVATTERSFRDACSFFQQCRTSKTGDTTVAGWLSLVLPDIIKAY
jgi:hypothetical protein